MDYEMELLEYLEKKPQNMLENIIVAFTYLTPKIDMASVKWLNGTQHK